MELLVKSILNTLKKHNAKAHFFVVESYIKNNPELVKRMEKRRSFNM